jgi:hypothetical protein
LHWAMPRGMASMELPEVEALVAKALGAGRVVIANPLDVAHKRKLRSLLAPLADRKFEPVVNVTPYKRGLLNQAAFLAEILSDHIERDTSFSVVDPAKEARGIVHGAERLLVILAEFLKETE